MINYTQQQFDNIKNREFLSLKCDLCGDIFERTKHMIKMSLQIDRKTHYCSSECFGKATKTKKLLELVTKPCLNCGLEVSRLPSRIRHENTFCDRSCASKYNSKIIPPPHNKHKETIIQSCGNCGIILIRDLWEFNQSKSGLIFCNLSCSSTYHAKHKIVSGVAGRSKLELYLEKELQETYPNVKFLFNERRTIGFELDILAPDLKLAVELNGPTHYKVIYGQEKFDRTLRNDEKKIALCQEKGIKLLVLDTTSQDKFSETSSSVFLSEIKDRIDPLLF